MLKTLCIVQDIIHKPGSLNLLQKTNYCIYCIYIPCFTLPAGESANYRAKVLCCLFNSN